MLGLAHSHTRNFWHRCLGMGLFPAGSLRRELAIGRFITILFRFHIRHGVLRKGGRSVH